VSNINTKPNLDNVNKTIQEVQGGATTAKLDKMVSDAVQSNRKLQKFIKFSIYRILTMNKCLEIIIYKNYYILYYYI
jgi:hypothetical protein